ncbi:MAG: peptidoglycan DD-metalloendopeptidase family protein [Hyphomicrobium sp.]|jgi:murein DD-endopeptidase MepM/ murein hydrolase activator NlpD
MMRFMRFHRNRALVSQSAARAAILLVAGLSGGCTASVSGFDFPSFSLNDDKPQQTASGYGRSNLGNDGYGSGGAPYSPPRTYRESSVNTQSLPDATPSAYSGGRTGSKYASDNARGSTSTKTAYNSPNYNSYTANGRYGTVAPASTASTNRYDPQPTPSLANPGDSIEVQQGDTLYGISRRHNVSVAELMQLNSLTNPNLKLGQRLYLPQGVAANRASPPPVTQTASVSVPPLSSDAPSRYHGSYTVRPGDSIYGISRMHGVSAAELQQANGITDARSVKAGTVLRVPGHGTEQPLQQVAVAPPASSPTPSYQPSNVSSGQQPTILNGAQPGSSYTQVTTRNTNYAATGTSALPAQPRQSVASSDKLRWPVSGRIISGFGQRSDGTQNDGINMSVPLGTSVHAAESGTVAYAGSELKGYGNLILVRHDNGWVTAYAHNDQLNVKRGDKVQRGQVIATAGRSGSVDQPQVHFELRQGSKPVDPVPFLERL